MVRLAKRQDKLGKGVLIKEDGREVDIGGAYYWVKFAPGAEQDRLKESLIKVKPVNAKDSTVDHHIYFPINAVNYVELVDKSDCFIATAVYGNRDSPQVKTIRGFRDNVLRQSPIGRSFIRFYYSGAGRGLAEIIKKSEPMMAAVRKGLDFIVEKYS